MTDRLPRTPNFKRIIITGALLGLAIGLYFGLRESGGPSYNAQMNYDEGGAAMFLGAFGIFIGAGVGGVVALLLDRTSRDS